MNAQSKNMNGASLPFSLFIKLVFTIFRESISSLKKTTYITIKEIDNGSATLLFRFTV